MKNTHLVMRAAMNKSLVIVSVGLCWLTQTSRLEAAGKSWNTTAGVWETPGNWSPATAPGSGDDITIAANGTYTVSVTNSTADTASSTMTVSTLSLGGGTGVQTLSIDYTNTTQALEFTTAANNGVSVANGPGSRGEIDLIAGRFVATNGIAEVGFQGTGTLNMSGGTMIQRVLQLGVVNNTSTGVVTMAGGNTTITLQLWLGGSPNQGSPGGVGRFTLNGGTLSFVSGAFLGLGGTAGGDAIFTMNGGTFNDATGAMYIGYQGGSTGTFNSVGGNLLSSAVQVGYVGLGRWNITGGTNQATSLAIGTVSGTDDGGVVVSGNGLLEVGSSGIAMGNGANTPFLTNQVGGTLRFTAANPTITLNNASSKVVVTNAAVEFKDQAAANTTGNIISQITYLGGNNTLRLNNSTNVSVSSMTFSNGAAAFSTLAMVNGNTRWNGNFLSTGAGGAVLLTNTQATFSGVFTNQGTFSSYHSSATFEGKVVNSGAWITDPTTNNFNGDYALTSGGTISMAAGDVYTFKSNFVNQSTQNNQTTGYNTLAGKFVFNGSSLTQMFYTAGKDLGPEAGYTPGHTNNVLWGTPLGTGPSANNFALGTLEISNSSTVKVSDAFSVALGNDDGQRAALYLDQLTLGQNSELIIDTNVTVYFSGSNNWAAANASVFLVGDAELHELVPEPSVLLLWASGLGLLGYLRRRSARR